MYKINQFLKWLFNLFIIICISAAGLSSEECKAVNKGFAVVELFTSEGCSDCPPADKNIIELSKFDSSKNIYPLAFHVTYWDYIGWKDPYGKQEFTDRQEKYSSILGTGNYTPQAIVNGKIDIIGSRRTALISSIEKELANIPIANIELNIIRKGSVLDVRYKLSCLAGNNVLNIALVEKGLSNTVTRGENRSKTLSHENVVRVFRSVSLIKNIGVINLEFSGIEKNPGNFEIIAYAQDNKTFAISAATSGKIN